MRNFILLLSLALLFIASCNKRPLTLKVLVKDKRADPNVCKNNGWSPLYAAVYHNRLENIKVLLTSSKLDPNIMTNGETPLHLAHRQERRSLLIELLKDKRTDATIPDKNGKIVLALISDVDILKHIPT